MIWGLSSVKRAFAATKPRNATVDGLYGVESNLSQTIFAEAIESRSKHKSRTISKSKSMHGTLSG